VFGGDQMIGDQRSMKRSLLMISLVTLVFCPSVFAAPPKLARAEAIKTLVACRSMTASEERLACYDREVAQFDHAEQSQQIFVIDRTEAEANRRGLFGLKLPNLRIPGTGASTLNKLDAAVASVRRDNDGRILFTLQDGARWHQIDDRPVSSRLDQGTKVLIERAALGSFFATFEKFGSIRVKRED
jgi:hypothetical protein